MPRFDVDEAVGLVDPVATGRVEGTACFGMPNAFADRKLLTL